MVNILSKNLCPCCFEETGTEPCPHCGYSKSTYEQDLSVLPIGSVLEERYVTGMVLGNGGFGVTYLAYDTKLDCKVAVKEYYPLGMAIRTADSTVVSANSSKAKEGFKNGAEKFYNEARIVAGLNGNPNIVNVSDVFYENGTVYFIMGYLEGMTLKEYISKHGNISEEQAVYIAGEIANALSSAHKKNLMHRDIAPDNIMICTDGTVKLLDFGAARQVVAEQSASLSIILKQGFAPLEQYQKRGKQGPWTDIYALGATIYYALTGDLPEDPMTRMDDDEGFSSNLHNISPALWEMIKKATMLKISDRYQDIYEFLDALDNSGIAPKHLVKTDNRARSSFSRRKIEQAEAEASFAPAMEETVALKEEAPVPAMEETVALKEEAPVPAMEETVALKEETPVPAMEETAALKEETPVPDMEKTVALKEETPVPDMNATVALNDVSAPAMEATVALNDVSAPAMEATVALNDSVPDMNATVALNDSVPDMNATVALEGARVPGMAVTVALDNAKPAAVPEKSRKKKLIIPAVAAAIIILIVVIILHIPKYSYEKVGSTVKITHYSGLSRNVKIPSEIGGDPVVGIGTKAFYESRIRRVTIPEGVSYINKYAFAFCRDLESVTIPDGVARIESYAFRDCESLKSITLPDSTLVIGENAFANCTNLESVSVSADCYVFDNAFSGCPNVRITYRE